MFGYWGRKSYRVHVYENVYKDLKGQKGCGRRDNLGNLWRFKDDKAAQNTPNVCIEQTVDASKAHLVLRLVEGQVWVITKTDLQALLAQYSVVMGVGDGDEHSAP